MLVVSSFSTTETDGVLPEAMRHHSNRNLFQKHKIKKVKPPRVFKINDVVNKCNMTQLVSPNSDTIVKLLLGFPKTIKATKREADHSIF